MVAQRRVRPVKLDATSKHAANARACWGHTTHRPTHFKIVPTFGNRFTTIAEHKINEAITFRLLEMVCRLKMRTRNDLGQVRTEESEDGS